MSTITSSTSVSLFATVSAGLPPYDQCARWSGGYTANNGTFGTLLVSAPGAATGNIPYINSSIVPCSAPGTSGGSLTGTLVPNGFTGTVSTFIKVADSSGIFGTSQTRTYTVLPPGALVVNAGPDQSENGPGPRQLLFDGSSVTGGSGPYAYLWTQNTGNPGTPIVFVPATGAGGSQSTSLNPTATGFVLNGTYEFTLTATDSIGNTGADNMQVIIAGAVEPVEPPPAAALSWSITRGFQSLGTFTIMRRRSGQEITLVNVSGTNNGTILVGANGLLDGDQIRIRTENSDGGGAGNASTSIALNATSRTAPYGMTLVNSVSNNPSGGVPSVAALPSASTWTVIEPSFYWYEVNATASIS